MSQIQNKSNNWILIPFHSRVDLLEPLLIGLSSFNILLVDDSDGLLKEAKQPKHVSVLKNTGQSSFANSVNLGLEWLEKKGVQRALVLNDDAEITEEDCLELFQQWKPKLLISPVIFLDGEHLYGLRVRSWGRVFLLKENQPADALLGTCLLIGTELRFDAGFPHGFEDIELCLRAKKLGYTIHVLDSVVCGHIGEGSLSRKQRKGQRYSTYGYLRLFSSRRKAPIIGLLSLLQILRERGDSERYLGWLQGIRDWVVEK